MKAQVRYTMSLEKWKGRTKFKISNLLRCKWSPGALVRSGAVSAIVVFISVAVYRTSSVVVVVVSIFVGAIVVVGTIAVVAAGFVFSVVIASASIAKSCTTHSLCKSFCFCFCRWCDCGRRDYDAFATTCCRSYCARRTYRRCSHWHCCLLCLLWRRRRVLRYGGRRGGDRVKSVLVAGRLGQRRNERMVMGLTRLWLLLVWWRREWRRRIVTECSWV